MAIIKYRNDLVEYVKQVERQQDVLLLSDVFTTTQKIAISNIYNELIVLFENKLQQMALNIEVNLN